MEKISLKQKIAYSLTAGILAVGFMYVIKDGPQVKHKNFKSTVYQSLDEYLRKFKGDHEVIPSTDGDKRTFFVYLQQHAMPDQSNRGIKLKHSPDSALCQIQIYREIRGLYEQGLLDAVSIEGFNKNEGDLSAKINADFHLESRKKFLSLPDQTLQALLLREGIGAGTMLAAITGIKVYGWEEFYPSQIEELNKLANSKDLSSDNIAKLSSLMDGVNGEIKKRSEISYANTMELSNRLQQEGKMGNIAIVIGSLHALDYQRMSKPLVSNLKRPRIILLNPNSCSYTKTFLDR